jgi:chemotaxis protein CheC
MAITMQNLTEVYLDALREVGNIGAGNAMTALATMIDCRVDMSVPRVGIVSLNQFTQMAGGSETLAVGVYMPVTGDAPGHVAFLLPERSACRLVDQLMGRQVGETASLDEVERSALMEVGNILASSYLVAICELTGLNLYASPPALAIDMTAAILSSIASAFAPDDDQTLTIVTQIQEDFGTVEGFFIFVPEPGSLSVMLHALQMEG